MSEDSRPPHAVEPRPLTVFVLFFAGLFLSGLVGIYLWNANPGVGEGKAFGTESQVSSVQASAGAAAKGAVTGADPALVLKGQQLSQQLGCVACHSLTGQAGAGPSWKGIAGSQRDLDNGQKVSADDAYLREAILQPDARIVKGFAKGVMGGAVAGVMTQLQADDSVDALIAYIKSVK